ncbi:hypothetical protein BIFPSEUDO_03165 [Bifidobacterium pseudocatenulatum DSM 20438 = JCM 1200 = LMG 10505]|uniref:Uncharacterized protein n=1 Tax=Bifidobacterium pseudocatenulatum DSM 20438 = JCM 1200 = LMG 10505 TaxID=547043 RepID=C0BRA1_BIFPS|nr:hypothetical protein BIFPSEUDO_03165 [Bifidobacterium pseudocatenulatum DSM 20438 = JCM 1200 = LMG 10505]
MYSSDTTNHAESQASSHRRYIPFRNQEKQEINRAYITYVRQESRNCK